MIWLISTALWNRSFATTSLGHLGWNISIMMTYHSSIWVSKKFFTARMLIFPEFMHFSHLEKSTGHVFFQCCVVHLLCELTEDCVEIFFVSEKTVPSMLNISRTRTMWSCFCSESCESWHRRWDRKCVMEGRPPPPPFLNSSFSLFL